MSKKTTKKAKRQHGTSASKKLLAAHRYAQGRIWAFQRTMEWWDGARPKDVVSAIAVEYEKNLECRDILQVQTSKEVKRQKDIKKAAEKRAAILLILNLALSKHDGGRFC